MSYHQEPRTEYWSTYNFVRNTTVEVSWRGEQIVLSRDDLRALLSTVGFHEGRPPAHADPPQGGGIVVVTTDEGRTLHEPSADPWFTLTRAREMHGPPPDSPFHWSRLLDPPPGPLATGGFIHPPTHTPPPSHTPPVTTPPVITDPGAIPPTSPNATRPL